MLLLTLRIFIFFACIFTHTNASWAHASQNGVLENISCNPTISNEAMFWSKSITSGSAKQVSEFSSSLDAFLKQGLGESLFESNVSKLYLAGRPFILIADRHLNPLFRSMLTNLITQIHNQSKDKPMAFFLEGIGHSEIQKLTFTDYLRGQEPHPWLFGLENDLIFAATDLVAKVQWFQKNMLRPQDLPGFIYALWKNPTYQRLWFDLKKDNNDKDEKEMIREIDQTLQLMQDGNPPGGFQFLKSCHFYNDNDRWIKLFNRMALLAIKNAPLSKTNKMLAQETLQDLSNNASYEKFMDLVAMTERNRYWVENIEIAMSNFPLETEIVIFAGCLHMPGLVKGLSTAQ